MSLETYRKKRRFGVTSEPRGKRPAKSKKKRLAFVVQKHRATALHYDVRLEWEGVMLSWAVPKGPSLDPSEKRLAMRVEDHPLEYNAFEGIIPKGEYGGGTVMIWDRGTWTPDEPDVAAALAKGHLSFRLEGKKLHGGFTFVRTRPSGKREQWLLVKRRDDAATTDDVAETAPRSVKSGRILAEIARDEGGDIARAAEGDPPSVVAELVAHPERIAKPKRRRKPAVWHSKKRG